MVPANPTIAIDAVPPQPERAGCFLAWLLRPRQLLALIFLLLLGFPVFAEPVGQVVNLSGPLFAVNAQGVQRVLALGSQVEAGETLITTEKTYAQVRFTDSGVVTLRPNTQFAIDSYRFDSQDPERDQAEFGLVRGALRALTGLIGKRGDRDAYRMNTATATIGIRGTQFVAQFIPEGASPPASPPGGNALAAGLYVQVIDGAVELRNAGGSQLLAAGQFGYAASLQLPPTILPRDPGIEFAPPASFEVTQQQASQTPPGEPVRTPSLRQNPNPQQSCIVR